MKFLPLPRNFALLLLSLGVVLVLAGCVAPSDNVTGFNTVVIDAGHGGHDSGAIARGHGSYVRKKGRKRVRVPAAPRVLEKDVALDVARKVDERLSAGGLHTVMTRRDDRFIPLDERVAISNRHRNSVFLSIHFNHSPKRHVHGAEVYHNDKGTALFAKRILRSLDAVPQLDKRGVKTANFRVLRKSQGAALLVECAYLSNSAEAARSNTPAYRQQIADAISRAVLEQRR